MTTLRFSLSKFALSKFALTLLAFCLLLLGATGGAGVHAAPPVTSGLVLDLESKVGVYKDAAKTQPCTTAGDIVAVWADQSGNGQDFVQATSTYQPIYQPAGLSASSPSIRCNGSSFLTLADASGSALKTMQNGSYTIIFALSYSNTTTDYETLLTKATVNGQSARFWFQSRQGAGVSTRGNLTNYLECYAPTHGDTGRPQIGQVYIVSYTFALTSTNTGTETFRVNGLTVAQRTGAIYPLDTTSPWELGAGTLTGAYGILGDVGAMLMYNSVLSTANLVADEAYLRTTSGAPSFPTFSGAGRLIVVGDSITEGYYSAPNPATNGAIGGVGGYNWPSLAISSAHFNGVVLNMAIAGITATNYQAALTGRLQPALGLDPNTSCLVHLGTNDIATVGAEPNAYTAIQSLCQAAKTSGAKVGVFTILPRATTGTQMETDRQTLRSSLLANYTSYANVIIDLGADQTIGLGGQNENATYYHGDALHPNPAGTARIAADALPFLSAILPQTFFRHFSLGSGRGGSRSSQ